MSKPIDPAAPFAMVEQDVVRVPNATGEAASTSVPAVDRASLLHRIGGDEELLAEIIELFLEDCPKRVAALTTAIDGRDPEALRLAAHALKGVAGNLSATALIAAAGTLERMGAEGRVETAPAVLRELTAAAALVMDTLRQWLPAAAGRP